MSWLNPELSVGRRCEFQVFGYVCYVATGAARKAFDEVAPQIQQLLNANKEELEKGLPSRALSFDLIMVAKTRLSFFPITPSEESIRKQTKPTIVILSTCSTRRKRALALIKMHKVLENYLGISLMGLNKNPAVEVASSSRPILDNGVVNDIYIAEDLNATYGSRLCFPTGKTATLGGFVTINGAYYGMTAFHPAINSDEGDLPEELEDLRFDNDDSQSSGEFQPTIGESISDTFNREFCQPASSPRVRRPSVPKYQNWQQPTNSPKLGTFIPSLGSRDLDYLLFPVEEMMSLGNKVITKLAAQDDINAQEVDKRVWAETSNTGRVNGVLLDTPCFIKLPGSSTVQEMWAIQIERHARPGDCGSWVVDELTQKLYGQIVAGDPHSHIAYIIPAHRIFEDIKSKSGTMPELPYVTFLNSLSSRQDSTPGADCEISLDKECEHFKDSIFRDNQQRLRTADDHPERVEGQANYLRLRKRIYDTIGVYALLVFVSTIGFLALPHVISILFPFTLLAKEQQYSLQRKPSSAAAPGCSAAIPISLPLGNVTIIEPNSPDIFSWGIVIRVGNSSQVCTAPSTVVNGTLLMSSEICDTPNLNNETAAQCRSRRGNFVKRSDLTPSSIDSLPSDPGWATIMAPSAAFQYAVNAVLRLRSDASVQMPEGLITEGQNHTTSHLGLGFESELLNELVNAGMTPGRSWGLNSGSQSVMDPRYGNLVLGGYDENSVGGSFVDYSINYPVGSGGHDCPLQVTVESMILRPAGGSGISLSDGSSRFISCIEPYDNLLRLPTNVHQLFLHNTGLSSQVEKDPSILVLEPGITYHNSPNSTFGFNASLIIKLNNGFQVEIPNYELVHPLRGLAQNGSPVLNTSIMEVQVHSNPLPLGSAVLGKAFLSQVYLGVDYDQKIFKLAQLNTDAVIPVPVPFQKCPSKLNATSIGLIVLGIVLALLLLSILFIAIRKAPRFRKAEHIKNEEDLSKLALKPRDPTADGEASDIRSRTS